MVVAAWTGTGPLYSELTAGTLLVFIKNKQVNYLIHRGIENSQKSSLSHVLMGGKSRSFEQWLFLVQKISEKKILSSI